LGTHSTTYWALIAAREAVDREWARIAAGRGTGRLGQLEANVTHWQEKLDAEEAAGVKTYDPDDFDDKDEED
jgi:hypothetical protein